MRDTAMRRTAGRGMSLRDLQCAVARYRVLLAAGLAAGAVAAGLTAVAPPPASRVEVLTVARDLPAGAVLTPEDLVVASVPDALLPTGAFFAPAGVVGRSVAGPVRRGETLTDVRLLGAGLLPAGSEGSEVAVPVRVAEPAAAALVEAGDRIDVLAAPPEGGAAAAVVAAGVRVLSVPALGDDPGEGSLLVVAAGRPTAARLAAAAVSGLLSVVVLPR